MGVGEADRGPRYIVRGFILPRLHLIAAQAAYDGQSVGPSLHQLTCLMHTMLGTVIEVLTLAYIYTPPLYVWATGQ